MCSIDVSSALLFRIEQARNKDALLCIGATVIAQHQLHDFVDMLFRVAWHSSGFAALLRCQLYSENVLAEGSEALAAVVAQQVCYACSQNTS
jgi:hypothetical protein